MPDPANCFCLWAEVDLDALARNVRQLKAFLGSAKLLSVVKANAYGHGAVPVAAAALAAGADCLGVSSVVEGVQLRRGGVDGAIVILGHTNPWDAASIVEHRLTPSVTTKQLALALACVAAPQGRDLPVHVKVDTGLNRYGLIPEDVPAFVGFLQGLPGLIVEGVYSHFATADETDKAYAHRQLEAFVAVCRLLPDGICRHIANSAAVFDMPEAHLDMARPGIGIYGLYPSTTVGRRLKLTPVLSLKALLARVFAVAAGAAVSYGRTWVAPRPSVLALVPCGYADGLPRSLSNRGEMLVGGRRAPIVGRVCMDQCVIDVTDVAGVAPGDEAVIIGRQGDDEITADEVAEWAETIHYEILCGLAARVPRLYRQNSQWMHNSTLLD